jgi:hypothetical protein
MASADLSPPRGEARQRAGCRSQFGHRSQFGQGSAGCEEGGSSSSCSSISASRRRVRSSSWSRSGDGGLASSRRAILRSCIARFSSGSIVCRKPVVKPMIRGGSSGTPHGGTGALHETCGVRVSSPARSKISPASRRRRSSRRSRTGRSCTSWPAIESTRLISRSRRGSAARAREGRLEQVGDEPARKHY